MTDARKALIEKEAKRRCGESGYPLTRLASEDRMFCHDDFRSWWEAKFVPVICREIETLEKAGFAVSSPLPGTREEVAREALIHTICPHIKQWSDGDDTVDHNCEKCPATVHTSYGEGVQMCRLNAEKCADAVLAALPPAPMPERGALNIIHELEDLRLSFRKEHRHADAETITNAISLLGGRTAPMPEREGMRETLTKIANATHQRPLTREKMQEIARAALAPHDKTEG